MSEPSPDLERRSALEIRSDGSRIVGYAIRFDSPSRDLGGFTEVVRSCAVDRSLDGDVVALYEHQPGAILGRTPTTLQLRKDDDGLAFTIMPPETQVGRDALTLVSRGDLKGASFGFRTLKDAWITAAGRTTRELLDIDIAEISLTAFPAYTATDATVAQRSLQTWQRHRGLSIRWLRMRHQLSEYGPW